MSLLESIAHQEQTLARLEKQLALEKVKARRQDTRRKIEFGGLVIKSGMSAYPKSVILGALIAAQESMNQEPGSRALFEAKGKAAFLQT